MPTVDSSPWNDPFATPPSRNFDERRPAESIVNVGGLRDLTINQNVLLPSYANRNRAFIREAVIYLHRAARARTTPIGLDR